MTDEREQINRIMKENRKRISNMIKEALPDLDAFIPGTAHSEELTRRIDKMVEAQLPDFNALVRQHKVEDHIKQAIKKAQDAGDLPNFEIPDIPMVQPRLKTHGDLSFPAMRLAKYAKTNPLDIAKAVEKMLPQTPLIEKTEIVPPGFINCFLKKDHYKSIFDLNRERRISEIVRNDFSILKFDIGEAKTAQVEFVSANPSGPITIGHARGAVLGDAMARLLEAAGYEVQREYYYNNAGVQMVKLGKSLKLRYLQQLGDSVEIPKGYYQGEYLTDVAVDIVSKYGDSLRGSSWEFFKDAAESRMFEWITRSLAAISIKHDKFFNETSLFDSGKIWQVLEELRERGHIYEAAYWEGADEDEIADVNAKGYAPATWFRSSSFGDEKDRVMVKSNGVPTYTLPDIAYHYDKLERGFDIAAVVLGTDHYSQVQVVKNGIRALGMDQERIHVIFNQMVRAVRRNEETGEHETVKQSKRAGDFDTLDDLVEMTSADAVRYHMLARSPKSQLDFDVDQVVKQSIDNPVYYIQNAHVRCASILRNAEAHGLDDSDADLSLLGEDEKFFIDRALYEINDAMQESIETFEPHHIAFCADDLADIFHPIYDRVRVLHSEVSEDKAKARLRFYRASKHIFQFLLQLMGMSAPERM